MPGLSVRVTRAVGGYRYPLLAGVLATAFLLPQLVHALDGAGDRSILLAQKDDDKKKKGAPPPPPKKGPPPAPPQKQTTPPPAPPQKQTTPPPAPPQKQTTPPPAPPQKQTTQPPPGPPPQKKQVGPPPGPPPQKKIVQPPKGPPPDVRQKKFEPKETGKPPPKSAPKQTGEKPPPKGDPKVIGKPKFDKKDGKPQFDPTVKGKPKFDPKTGQKPPPAGPPVTFGKPKPPPGPQFNNVNQVRKQRKQIKEDGRTVIVEPGGRRIIRDGKRLIIRRDESARMRRWGNPRVEVRGGQRFTTVRRGNFDIVTVTDGNGRLIRRFRRGPDGREYVLINNLRRGAVVGVGVIALGLAAPRILIPRDRYMVNARGAPPELIYETFEAGPEQPLPRTFLLDEIVDNVELRDHLRSVDVSINFATGSWEVPPDQIPLLEKIAEAMQKIIEENPSSVFLIEGHTDLVGNPEDNLSLSDRRAEAVAEILTTNFQIPPENIVTQGFGEQHPVVQTDGPSQENRRVAVRNITTLLAGKGGGPPGGPDEPPPDEDPNKPPG